MTQEITLDAIQARYKELCDKRDAVYARIDQKRPSGLVGLFTGNYSLREQLDEANLEVIRAQERANKLAAKINEIRGGEEWLKLKKEIGLLAALMSKR